MPIADQGATSTSSVLLLELLMLNAIVAAILALLLLPLRPKHLRSPVRRDYLALVGTGILVPVAGPLLMLFQLLLFIRFSHTHTTLKAEHLVLSPFVPDEPRQLGHFGMGGALHGLQSGAMNTERSIRALMSVEQQRSARTSKVLFDTLGHPDEAVRLTAAGLLDRRETRVLQMMARVEKIIINADPSHDGYIARLHLQAAMLDAEMLYLRLAREGMARLYLDRWDEHLKQSEAHFSKTPAWLISKARWLQRSDLPGSGVLYRQALEAGAAPSRVMPYLAESLWERRDYAGLRELVESAQLFGQLPVSGVITRRWRRPVDMSGGRSEAA